MDQTIIVEDASAGPYRVTVYVSLEPSGSGVSFRIRTITKGSVSRSDQSEDFPLPYAKTLSGFIEKASDSLQSTEADKLGKYDKLGFFARRAAKILSYRLLSRIDDGKYPILTLYLVEGKKNLGQYLLLKGYQNSFRVLPLEFIDGMKEFLANKTLEGIVA